MRSYRAQNNQLAVSANSRETAINTPQTLDTLINAAVGDIFNVAYRRVGNEDEQTGWEEPTQIYDQGQTVEGPLTFDKAMPQHYAIALGYGLGTVSTAASGGTGGYVHTITPIEEDLDARRSNPSFTVAQRYGNQIAKRRFASCFVDQLTATFSRDEFCKISARVLGTGLVADNVVEESITAADDVTTLTLAAHAVHGADAQERLDNVQRVRAELEDGVWTEVVYSAVDDSTPSQITITAPGATSEDVTYKVLYISAESGWMTFPAAQTESPLRFSDCTITLGGAWDGSDFAGGRTVDCEISQIEYSLANNGQIEFCGANSDYAGRYFRDGRVHTLTMSREFREFIYQNHLDENDTFGAQIVAEGAEYDTGYNYRVTLIFPKLSVMAAPISADGKRLSETVEIAVLADSTYGPVIAKVENMVATYAA